MRSFARAPIWIPPGSPAVFPDPNEFEDHGLLAGGGDLTESRLLAAYRRGIFPWYDSPPILWWSPNPRAVISRESLHLSRSMKRLVRKTPWSVTVGKDLAGVMQGCADRSEGTWLSREMQRAYLHLGSVGHCLSYEVWDSDDLVGGLYGVLIGGFYAAESKFHRATDASKLALVCAVTDLFDRGVTLIDVQFVTDHLKSLGVHEVSRSSYLESLKSSISLRLSAPCPTEDVLPRVRNLLDLG
jgi:leucyl/phenylalanyl-tRNA--protein transferase